MEKRNLSSEEMTFFSDQLNKLLSGEILNFEFENPHTFDFSGIQIELGLVEQENFAYFGGYKDTGFGEWLLPDGRSLMYGFSEMSTHDFYIIDITSVRYNFIINSAG